MHQNTDDGTSQSKKKVTLKSGRHSFCLSFPARAQEQPQWSDRSAESMISRPPMCGNCYHPKGNALFTGGVRYPTIVPQNSTPKILAGLKICTPIYWWSYEKTNFPT